MENIATDVEQIDQELQELKSRFSRADIVLRELEDIQVQFESLADTHQKLKEHIAKVSRLNDQSDRVLERIKQAQNDSEKYLAELREKNHIQLDEVNSRILESQSALNTHSSSIQSLQSGIESLTEDLTIKKRDFDQIFNNIDLLSQEVGLVRKKHNLLGKQINIIKTAIVSLVGLNLFLIAWICLK